jgi:hypothetical protein
MSADSTQSTKSKNKEVIIGCCVVVVIAVLVLISTLANKSSSSSNSMAEMTTTKSAGSSSTTPSSSVSGNTKFKDGSYTAVGSYEAPGEKESITVTLTLDGGVVENASVTEGYKSSESQLYQDQFVSAYKQSVIGKKITSINLSHVAASSLTSQGFDAALKQIEQQAAEA